jgi:hypothetical protein
VDNPKGSLAIKERMEWKGKGKGGEGELLVIKINHKIEYK